MESPSRTFSSQKTSKSFTKTHYSKSLSDKDKSHTIHPKTESTRLGVSRTPHRSHRRKASSGGVLNTPQRVLRNNLLQKSLSKTRESCVEFRSTSPTLAQPVSKGPSKNPDFINLDANRYEERATLQQMNQTSHFASNSAATEHSHVITTQRNAYGMILGNRSSQEPAKKRRKASPELGEPDDEIQVELDAGNREIHESNPIHIATKDTSTPKATLEDHQSEDTDFQPTQRDDLNWEIINDEDISEAPPLRYSAETPSETGSTSPPRRGGAGGSLKQRNSLRKVITGRVSKFKEGSMNDRISARPPEELLLSYVDSQASQSSAMMRTYRPFASTERTDRTNVDYAAGVNSVLSHTHRQGRDGIFHNSKGEPITGKEEFTLTGLLGSIFHGRTLDYCRDNWWGPAKKKYHDRFVMNQRKERAIAVYASMKERKKTEENEEGLTSVRRAVTTPVEEKVGMVCLRGKRGAGAEEKSRHSDEVLTGSHKRKYSQLTYPPVIPSFQFNDFGGRGPINYSFEDNEPSMHDQESEEATSGYSCSHADSGSGSGSFSAPGYGSANEDNKRLSVLEVCRRSRDKGKQKDAEEAGGSGSSFANLKKRASKILVLGSKDKEKNSPQSQAEETQIRMQTSFSSTASQSIEKRQLSKRELAKAERLRKKVSMLEMKLLDTWKELEAMGEVVTQDILASPPPVGSFHGNGYGYSYASTPSSPKLSASSEHRTNHYGPQTMSRSTMSLARQDPLGVETMGMEAQTSSMQPIGEESEERV